MSSTAPSTAVRGTRCSARQASSVPPMTGTVAAAKPIWTVASTTGGSCSSFVTESDSRNSVTRPVIVQPVIRAARPVDGERGRRGGW